MTIIAGLDPGLDGALAFIDTETQAIEIIDMPTLNLAQGGKNRREVDPHAIANIFWQRHAGHAFLERAWNRPGEGGTQGFKSGMGYGALIGILAAVGVPVTLVAPNTWKKALQVPAAKDGARARASQLLPQSSDQWPRVKDDGRAEAALLCVYGIRCLSIIERLPTIAGEAA